VTLPRLTTDRLVLQPAGQDHLDLFAELNGDPEVMRYLLGRAATREEVEEEWAKRLGPWSDTARGLGYWIGFEEGDFVGWWSASSYAPDPTVAGVGYRLARSAWGRGLATEGVGAVVTHAFTVPGVERCVATTMAVNLPSRRVLEKAGFRHVDTYVGDWDDPSPGWEQGEVVYELRRRDWLGR
jgi:RimJ/RimL family protein N-acetyltransferase